ncbi:MAG TPA: hypothetical protein VMZ91_13940 [Candidatus Paceibacterota bacterium]|nr:hypothetical protein [Candidatus Paceibacterota bacterium]
MKKTSEEKDTRPVRCFICRRKMYYFGHPKFEPEYTIMDEKGIKGYAHVKCVIRNRK